MNKSLVLTVLGDDHPGLVGALSEVIAQHNGNWTESRMVEMSGKFAGLLAVSIPMKSTDAFLMALEKVQEDQGLHIQAELAKDEATVNEVERETIQLEVLGPDAPGIIQHITEQLANLNVNVEELCSEQRQAAMSGEILFFASMKLGLPEGVSEDKVRDALEGLTDQLMVDFNYH